MRLTKHLGSYLHALLLNWTGLISGGVGVIFLVLALYVYPDLAVQKTLFIVVAIVALLYSTFHVWRIEYVKSLHGIEILFENRPPYVIEDERVGSLQIKPDIRMQIKICNKGLEAEAIQVFGKLESDRDSTGVPLITRLGTTESSLLLNYKQENFVQVLLFRHDGLFKFQSLPEHYRASLISIEPNNSEKIVVTAITNRINISKVFTLSVDEQNRLTIGEEIKHQEGFRLVV